MTPSADIWPSSPIEVSPQVKHLITRLFEISDSLDPESGKWFADELFTKDAVFQTHETQIIRGYDEIAACRQRVEPVLESRHHELTKVFAANSPATDILVIGKFVLDLKDGNSVDFDFNARFVVVEDGGEQRFEFVRFWTDPEKMLKAQEKARKSLEGKD